MMQVPARRRIERRELISLFSTMSPGSEITAAEVQMRTGVDISQAGDRSLAYGVREHCREVLGFVMAYRAGIFTRVDDGGVIHGVLPRRRERIWRQAKRGVTESLAISDFAALARDDQVALLTYQSIMGALAVQSHRAAPNLIAAEIAAAKRIAVVDPETVVAVVKSIRQ